MTVFCWLICFLLGSSERTYGQEGLPASATGSVTWVDDHESLQCNWTDGGGTCSHQVLRHERVRKDALTGQTAEVFWLSCQANGDSILLARPLRPIAITKELLPSIGVKANRSGVQLMVRVVLPATLDPLTGRALTFYVQGGTYASVHQWQTLRVDHLATRFSQELNRLKAERGGTFRVDARGAYVDHLVLNAWCGAGTVQVALDSLEIAGVVETVPPQFVQQTDSHSPDVVPAIPSTAIGSLVEPDTEEANTEEVNTGQNEVHLSNVILMVDNTPIFVRAIRHRGESLELLAQLNFNTIWLSSPPTVAMEAEAKLRHLWFISPLPFSAEEQGKDATQLAKPSENYALNRVLAWDVGVPPQPNLSKNGTKESSLEPARRQSEWVRGLPDTLIPNRPLVATPDQNLRGYRSLYDILLLQRNPISSTQDLVSYGYWLRQIPNLRSAGRPLWTTVPTEYAPQLRAQWAQIVAREHETSNVSTMIPNALPTEQIRLMAYSAVTAGSRGLLFESASRLDAQDQETDYRRKSLAFVNTELMLLEQWISQGEDFTTLPSNQPNVVGEEIGIPHVKLMLPLCLEEHAQYVTGASAATNVEFVVRGMPSTYDCWRISPNGLEVLPSKRVAGGVQIRLDELPLVSALVMTQNQTIIHSLSQRCMKYGETLTRRMRDVAEVRLRLFLQFRGTSELQGEEAEWYGKAKTFLELSDKAFAEQEYSTAFLQAQRALRPIQYLEQTYWKYYTAKLPSPNFAPPATAFRSLSLLATWQRWTENATLGENLVPTGTLEDVRQMSQAGWIHRQPNYKIIGVAARADVVPEAARTGMNGLQLEVLIQDKKTAPVILDTPPVRIYTPPVRIPAGTPYQVEAWVNIPQKLINTVDGLKITDSNSGEVLAERIPETAGWQKVSYQRISTSDQPIFVEISLSGYGKVWVDDLSIRPISLQKTTP